MVACVLVPLVAFGLGRSRAPIESLAVWPVVQATAFVFRSGGMAFQEVGIALRGREVGRTGIALGGLASLALALVAFAPLERVWLERVMGLSAELASFAALPIRILVLLPLLDYLLSVQRADWIVAHRTQVVTIATVIEAAGLAVMLCAAVGPLGMVGAIAGAIATMAGRLAANGYLFGVRRRRVAAL